MNRLNPLKIDPTRTGDLRKRFEAELRRRLKRIAQRAAHYVLTQGEPKLSLNYSPGQARDWRGRWVGAAAGIGGFLKRVGSKVSAIADKIPGVAKVKAGIGSLMKGIHSRLEKRYGTRAATLIMTSGSIGGYGVMAIAQKLVGFPGVPIVNDLVSIAAHTAIAEVGLQLGRLRRRFIRNMLAANVDVNAEVEAVIRELANGLADILRDEYAGIVVALEDKAIWQAVADLTDAAVTANELTANDWRFDSDEEKLRRFEDFIRAELGSELGNRDVWQAYVEEGYRRGAGRAFDDTRRNVDRLEFWQGTREEFLRMAFGQPVSVNTLKLMVTQAANNIKGLSDATATKLTQILADGLVRGQHPRDIARSLAGAIDVSLSRAETIARTEMIRAFNEGALMSFEQLGVEEVGVMVEWRATGDGRTCPLCADLNGKVFKIEEAHGKIPRHPRCRCSFIPWLPKQLRVPKDFGPKPSLRESLAEPAMVGNICLDTFGKYVCSH